MAGADTASRSTARTRSIRISSPFPSDQSTSSPILRPRRPPVNGKPLGIPIAAGKTIKPRHHFTPSPKSGLSLLVAIPLLPTRCVTSTGRTRSTIAREHLQPGSAYDPESPPRRPACRVQPVSGSECELHGSHRCSTGWCSRWPPSPGSR